MRSFTRNREPFFYCRYFGRCAVLLLLLSLQIFFSSSVHATSRSTQPMVVIVKDITTTDAQGRQGTCLQTKTVTSKHNVSITTHSPCVPGAFLQTVVVSLAQAQLQHEPYVQLPATPLSGVKALQVRQQIDKLLSDKRQREQRSQSSKMVHPSSCVNSGAEVSTGFRRTIDNDSISFYVTYYVSVDCSSVALEVSEVQGWSAHNALYWGYNDSYAGWTFKRGYCPYVGTNDLQYDLTKDPDYHVAARGDNYLFSLTDSYCFTSPATNYIVSVGPLV